MSPAEQKALQNKYNKELPTSPTTHFNGEVRLQGSKYSMDPQARSLVDGSVSRSTGGRRNAGRSSEAAAASKSTMENVRARKALSGLLKQKTGRARTAKPIKARPIKNTVKNTGPSRGRSRLQVLLRRVRGK
jgi:hypothetical protein